MCCYLLFGRVVASAPVMLGHFKANLGSSRWAPAAIFSAACSAVQITGAWHQREFVIKRSRTIFLNTGIDLACLASL